jgi:hypothetical protein
MDCRLQVHKLLAGGWRGLVGYQGVGCFAYRHWTARLRQRVHGASKQRPALERGGAKRRDGLPITSASAALLGLVTLAGQTFARESLAP